MGSVEGGRRSYSNGRVTERTEWIREGAAKREKREARDENKALPGNVRSWRDESRDQSHVQTPAEASTHA